MYAHTPSTRLIAALAVLLPLTFTVASAALPVGHAVQQINAVIGDRSFIRTFGRAPSTADDERTRITAHLAYVEALLRARDVRSLPPELRAERACNLDRLHEYLVHGTFPANERYPGMRRPCFIDDHGAICAVGYLVERSAGRRTAETINREHQYEYIRDMRSPALTQWLASSGLTREEAAMIQPTYNWRYEIPRIERALRIVGPLWYFGVSGGCALALHQDVPAPAELGTGDPPVERASAFRPTLSLQAVRYLQGPCDWRNGLMLRLGYDDRSITTEHPQSIGPGPSLPAEVTTGYRLLSARLLFMQQVEGTGLVAFAGPSFGLPFEHRRRSARSTVDGSAYAFDPNRAYASTRFGVAAGLQYEIPVGAFASIAPTIAYDLRLTDIAAGTNWRTDALEFGIDLRVPLEEVAYEEAE